jgi:hypothetical protein
MHASEEEGRTVPARFNQLYPDNLAKSDTCSDELFFS